MRATFRQFVSATESWETLFARAADFATEVGRDRLISISHSHGGGTEMFGSGGSGVVTVWYWDQADRPSRPA
ncbi:MAG TPA: hypothetical protein VM533_07490 [Fimbriiglobus sp.]|nr:hypothetical protein [Fimbriiglobus sp.]